MFPSASGQLCKAAGRQQSGQGEGKLWDRGTGVAGGEQPAGLSQGHVAQNGTLGKKALPGLSLSKDSAGLGQRPREGGRSQVGSVHRTSRGGEGAPCSVGGAAAAVGSLISLLQVLGQESPFPFSPGIPEEPRGVGARAAAAAQGLSRRRVPGHLSHRKGTRRRVKVAVKV